MMALEEKEQEIYSRLSDENWLRKYFGDDDWLVYYYGKEYWAKEIAKSWMKGVQLGIEEERRKNILNMLRLHCTITYIGKALQLPNDYILKWPGKTTYPSPAESPLAIHTS